MDWMLRMPLHRSLSEYWLALAKFELARQEAERLCELAGQPGERTYLALGRRQLAAIALAERDWQRAETEIEQALAVVEGGEAPLAEWRVCATAGQLYERLHQRGEAGRYWRRSAEVLTRLGHSLGNETGLRQRLLTQPTALTVLRRAHATGWGDDCST
jgi:hypothetical protein